MALHSLTSAYPAPVMALHSLTSAYLASGMVLLEDRFGNFSGNKSSINKGVSEWMFGFKIH